MHMIRNITSDIVSTNAVPTISYPIYPIFIYNLLSISHQEISKHVNITTFVVPTVQFNNPGLNLENIFLTSLVCFKCPPSIKNEWVVEKRYLVTFTGMQYYFCSGRMLLNKK